MNILLIEDDIGLVELITETLEESGFSMINATSGAEALESLDNQTPDLILLDYSLPDINGEELIGILNNKQIPTPPFIITTGRGDERIAVDMMKLGAKDYLIKDKLFLEKVSGVVIRVIKEIERDGMLKQAQRALKESEATIRNKLKAIIEPEGDISKLALSDIIDTEALQSMMQDFYELTGMVGAVLDVSGEILVAVGWQDICTRFHRCNPESLKNCIESDTILTQGVPEGTFQSYHCKNNMWDIVTPLIVGGRHVGNVFMGQYFLEGEKPDIDFFRKQAKKYGFDEEKYLAALERVPRFSKETVNSGMKFYSKLAKVISTLSYNAIQQSRMLAERKLAEKSLKESEKRFRIIFDQAAVGVGRVSLDGAWIDVNKKFCDIVGYSKEELLTKTFQEISHPDELQKNLDYLKQLVKNEIDTFTMEKRYLKKDSEFVWINLTVSLVPEQSNSPGYLISIIEDITDRKLAEERLLEAVKNAEAASRAKSVFLSNITHDLRTPLNSIMGMSEILSGNDLDDKLRVFAVSALIESGDTLLQIIDDVIDLAKVEADEILLDKTLFNIISFTKSVIGMFEVSCKGKDIKIIYEVSDDLPALIWEDEHTLRRVLTNLIGNAVKFTPKGTIKVVVKLSNDMIVFLVRDTGVGIQEENIDKIVKPFTQEDSSITRQFGGSGLGLAIVQKFVDLMEGKFWIKSKKGWGSDFCFSLPLITPPASSMSQNKIAPHSIETKIDISPLNVLLADDSPPNCVLIKLFAQEHPVELDIVENGQVALEKYMENHEKYDLILMDLQMPILSGYEAVTAIRKWENEGNFSHTPIIALSASVMKEEVDKAISCGCDLHMAKPIKQNMLLKQLNDISSIKYNKDLLTWNSSLSVGHDLLDEQHQNIFSFLNQLRRSINEKQEDRIICKIVEELICYVKKHTDVEEASFMSSSYPGKYKHQEEHYLFNQELSECLQKLENKKISPVHFILLVKSWLSDHICKYDSEYIYYISKE